ncbi:hypothetical protein EPN42_05175 [bacterium]|nr:MAG: hypothetical protein EPN42_05175 [bacterium]
MKKMFLSVILAAAAMAALLATPALAEQYATRIVNQPNAPLDLQRCLAYDSPYDAATSLNVLNRSRHELIRFDIAFQFFDVDGTLIGEGRASFSPDDLVAPGDLRLFTGAFSVAKSEPLRATGLVTCKIVSAVFTGKQVWRYGQRWKEPLLPISAPETGSSGMSASSGAVAGAGQAARPSNPVSDLKVSVLNTWSDANGNSQPGLYVHDRLQITAGKQSVTVRPNDFVLTARLANGGDKKFDGLAQAAPRYLKMSWATNQNEWVPEVEPAQDLGGIGSLIVPANGTVTVTVTFFVPDPIADPKAVANVTYH